MKHHFLRISLAVVLLISHASSSAADTDLFVGLPPSPRDLPNVLFVLDNTANWNDAFINEINALDAVLAALPTNDDGTARFRVGLMMFTESGGANSGADGAYVRAAVRDMTAANKVKYRALIRSLDKINDKSNGGKVGVTMADAYRYFAGGAPYSGNNKVKTDYTGNTSGTAADRGIYTIANDDPFHNPNALTEKAGAAYTSPIVSGSCAKNFIIYLSNGPAADNSSDTATATTLLTGAGGSSTPIPVSPSGSQDNVADEWARFMRSTSMGIRTYTIDIDKRTTGQGPGWSALLDSIAAVSNAKNFDVSSSVNSGDEIVKAVSEILSEIQHDNSVFAAVSLPVSVNTQGTYRNQVFIGMFRPDGSAAPRWAGNLKQYKLGFIDNVLKLQDARNESAINANTGFIGECARSYWTPATVDNYWAFQPSNGCIGVPNSGISNSPDGNVVDKGAQAYALRNMATRPVKTCSSVFASCTDLINFNSASATQELLGAGSTAERDAIINWAKGLNPNLEGNTNPAVPVAPFLAGNMRPSAHGDVVHSRPVAINFGTEIAPRVVVFYGGNDGVLRAINGNRTANIDGVTPGAELWAFIPPEFYPTLKRIRDNTLELYYPGTPNATASANPAAAAKPYAIDGPVSAYKDGSNAYIYAAMRRGGRALYAFDVTNPGNPSLKWKKGCPADGGACTTGFDDIGQTWSSAKTFFSSSYGSAPLLIMGGGYDNCEDADINTCSTTKGNRIYVLDANTGDRKKTFVTERGVIADIFIVPNIDGTAKHAYAADLGGNVYRINIGELAVADWTITKIASLGCDTTAPCASNRKFMFAPDVIEASSGIYTLLIGSGDREKPLGDAYYPATGAVANHFFSFEDKPLEADWLEDELDNGVCGLAVICKNSLLPITTSATPTVAQLATKKGWYLGLDPTEQVVTSAITVFDNVTFSTHKPAVVEDNSCESSLGTASVYNISYKNASSSKGTVRHEVIAGGGLPPSPVAGNVTLDNGSTVPFCIGCNPDSPLEGGTPTPPAGAVQPKARVYWYIQK